jgi:hypothetical protein
MALELRAVIHFLWLTHISNRTILSELEAVYGKDSISPRAVEKWATAFEGGAPSLLICPDPGGFVALEGLTLSVR